MQRRKFIKSSLGFSLAFHPLAGIIKKSPYYFNQNGLKLSGPPRPVFIYNNWSSYDELSDRISLTEELAMKELNEVIRLKKAGVIIDYYVMDAFWFDPAGGYRKWHQQHWPNGPDKWFESCLKNNIRPGMWFSTNLISGGGNKFLDLIDEWKSSAGSDGGILCLFEGGYLNHLSDTLQMWYDKGVRLFKFDFAYFEAATENAKKKYTPEEIKEMNKVAFMEMLKKFRLKNPDILITGYNGFGGTLENTFTPFTKDIDLRWLDTFDTLYSGDPRFSDVPMMNIWRSEDTYADHQVRQFEFSGLPLRRIDSCAFMIGKTGTCYSRALQCWKGMLILDLARGGWVNVYHGNLELLNEEDAKWFAKVQNIYKPFQVIDGILTFGSIPGKGKPYGFKAEDKMGTLYTLVNPSQAMATVNLPDQKWNKLKVLYADGGYYPGIKNNSVTIGPEQLVVVGCGEYAGRKYDMGIDNTINIPDTIKKLESGFEQNGKNSIRTKIVPPAGSDLRIIAQQFDSNKLPYRSWGGAPPNGKKMNEFIKIIVKQNEKEIPTDMQYDKMIWSGLSWGVVEVKSNHLDHNSPVVVECISFEQNNLTLLAEIYAVKYIKIPSEK